MKAILGIVLCLLSVVGALGQDKPLPAASVPAVPYLSDLKQAREREGITPKPWYKSNTVRGGLLIIGGGITADAVTTAMRGKHSESSGLLGRHPSDGKIAGVSAANFLAQGTVHIFAYKLTHSPIQFSDGTVAQQDKLGWRIFSGSAIPAEVAALNIRNAINNLKYDK